MPPSTILRKDKHKVPKRMGSSVGVQMQIPRSPGRSSPKAKAKAKAGLKSWQAEQKAKARGRQRVPPSILKDGYSFPWERRLERGDT